ncbi:L-lactate permease [Achromobacter sp. GG226]|uniref:L-lactate permease n=1 Tax=Verticiella alkaliphila TaxID=2779529 RepID=UPI001C0DA84C|nr:L-lactate permease [Verticiella sp. GG226]
MTTLLAALPVLSTLLALGLGVRSLPAALTGVAAALLAIALAFPMPPGSIAPALLHWTPVLVEVLLIVGGGLLMSDVLRQAHGQAQLAAWIRARAGQGVGAVLLVVHGVTPFAESVTGFGIGVTIGIPLLAHFGLPARHVVLLGLLGLCTVPWGSMGPGTLIAATMAGLPFQTLGVASGMVSLIPFVVTGALAAWFASAPGHRGVAVLQGVLSGVLLTITVTGANALVGTAPAGALGALAIILLHVMRTRAAAGAAPALGPAGRRALASYALLLGGVLAAGALVKAAALPTSARYLASPALWLFIATAAFAAGWPARDSAQRAWRAWRQVGAVTAAFILLGVLMAVSGMAAFLAQVLAQAGTAYLGLAPFVGALGGFITGSNAGANAMFAATQASIAQSLDVDVLWFMAVHNVAAAFLLMASPGKVEMALQLAAPEAAASRRWIQAWVVGVALLVVSLLAGLNVLLA